MRIDQPGKHDAIADVDDGTVDGIRRHDALNPLAAHDDRLSTFAIDVDTGSWTLAKRFLQGGSLPNHNAVRVEESEGPEGELVLRLHVAEDDRGMVIGRGGRMVSALRTIARAAGAREDRRVMLEIVE